MKQSFFLLTAAIFLLLACGSGSKTQKNTAEKPSANSITNELPGYKVYKTKGDYSKLVPVILADDKSAIESSPLPSDLFVDGQFQYPAKLAQGYLLGRHGIGAQTAFLKWDYEKFFQDGALLSKKELNSLILDADPFLEMYNCVTRVEESVAIEYLNDLINNGNLQNQCTRVK